MVRECVYGSDMPFSSTALQNYNNSILADTLGNMVNRAVRLCATKTGQMVPDAPCSLPFDLDELRADTEAAMSSFDLQGAAELVRHATSECNKFITDAVTAKKHGDPDVIRCALEGCYVLAHFFNPTMPNVTKQIFDMLDTPPMSIRDLSTQTNLKPGTKLTVDKLILFPKIDLPDSAEKTQAAAAAAGKGGAAAGGKGAGKKGAAVAAPVVVVDASPKNVAALEYTYSNNISGPPSDLCNFAPPSDLFRHFVLE
jgi:methionyl-tRNA synthetase